MKRPKTSVALAVLLSLVLAGSVLAGSVQNSRLLPTDKVVVYDAGRKVAEYTREMPVPKGLALSCIGKCAVKLADISLVAEDKSMFSIDSKNRSTYLGVNNGVVYFRISSMTGPIVFMTPKGAVSVNQLFFNASSGAKGLEGYLKVSENASEVGVIEGGNLQLLTKDGRELIKPGHRFILAQAIDVEGEDAIDAADADGTDVDASDAIDSDDEKKGFLRNLTGGQVALAAAGGVAAFAIIDKVDDSSDDDASASPFRP